MLRSIVHIYSKIIGTHQSTISFSIYLFLNEKKIIKNDESYEYSLGFNFAINNL